MNQKVNSLYLHFPFCRHLCNYCDFHKNILNLNTKSGQMESWHQMLELSMLKHQQFLESLQFTWSDLDTFFMGGGTPSLWDKNGATHLGKLFKQHNISFSTDGEFTMEVNPGSFTFETLNAWLDFGINRISFGAQSLREDFIKILDRVHNAQEVRNMLGLLQEKKVNYSVDLMLGLPFSKDKKRNVIEELKEILEYEPSHISLYILTVRPNYVHFNHLPDDKWISEEYLNVSEFLTKQGFDHYEVSNFAKPEMKSRHNLKYWRSETVAALGPSATGLLNISSDKAIRYKWNNNDASYKQEILGPSELSLERFFLNFRTNGGVDPTLFFTGLELDKFIELSKLWESQRLGCWEDGSFILKARGMIVMDGLMEQIFQKINGL